MKTRLLSLVLSATAFLACSSSSATNDTSSGGTGDAGGTDPGVTPDDDGGGASSSGGGSSSGGPVAGAELKIGTASFRNVGRLGDAMRIQLTGTDPAAATSAAHLRFTDASDAPVNAVDTNWDGSVDSPEATYHFDASALGKASFDGAITIPSLFIPSSNVKKVFVSLENEAGVRSAETAVTLTAQTVAHADEACDAAKITSRCEAGLSCSGTPAKCQAATAPTWSKVAYFGGSSPRMAFRGEEADEDIGSISVEFLDNAGSAKDVVLTGEIGDPNATTGSSVTIDARASGLGTTFFLETQPTTGFVSQVPKIAATAMDRIGRPSDRVVVAMSPSAPIRSAGQACDVDGFDACTTGSVCAPGIRTAASNTCTSASTARSAKCGTYAALDPSAGAARAFGVVAGVSLWDAPIGCVGNDAKGRPETAIPLHLAAIAPSLTITTALPDTSFDTAIYLIPACATSAAGALGCNDDMKGYSSSLTLKNVPAGEYTIIVESVSTRGGRFGVKVSLD